MSNDRRSALRRALQQKCWIDFGPSSPPVECHLENVSKTGAKLTCDASVKIPDRFFLYLTRDGKVGRRCKVVRREDDGVFGLLFVKGPVPSPRWTDVGPDAV